MATFINQYSVIIAYLLLATAVFAVVRWRVAPNQQRVGLLIATAVLLFAALFLFQPTRQQATAVALQQALAQPNGRPVFVELYSDYCIACWRAKPAVEALAADWGEDVNLLSLNVHDPAARPLLDQLNFRYTPTYILFNAQGQEIWRTSGSPHPDEINAQLAQ